MNPGEMFDRYRIDDLVGRGGMGEVYRAHDTRLGRTVALKVLAADHTTGDAAARLLREARAAATILHPNAVAVFDVGEVGGVPYIAMEYVEGKTLRAYVGDTSVAMGTRIRWLADIARALGAAHEKGIVHRDVKPDNVMITTEGVVKVLDFGLARADAATDDGRLATITREGIIVGTLPYMSPEQLRGEEIDGRADQFAWGVVAYELVIGTRPWLARNRAELIAEIMSRSPDVSVLPSKLRNTVERALSADRRMRFPDIVMIVPLIGGVSYSAERGSFDEAALRAAETRTNDDLKFLPIHVLRKRTWRDLGSGSALVCIVLLIVLWNKAGVGRRAKVEPRSPVIADSTPSRHDAAALFTAAKQALRDGSRNEAREKLRQISVLEPSFSAAHVYMLILWQVDGTDEEMRSHCSSAIRGRASLTARESSLLNAYESTCNGRSDETEIARRVHELHLATPSDLEFALFAADAHNWAGEYRSGLQASDVALTSDSSSGWAYATKAYALRRLDREGEAYLVLKACSERAHEATDCLLQLTSFEAANGHCLESEKYARDLIALRPHEAQWYQFLARGIYGRGGPSESVRLALMRSVHETHDEEKELVRNNLMFDYEVAYGRFDNARSLLGKWAEAIAKNTRKENLDVKLHLEAELLLEEGRTDDASRVADAYIQSHDAWLDDYDGVVVAQAVKYLAGTISKGEFERVRSIWKRSIDKKGMIHREWQWAYAGTARTVEDRAEALRLAREVEATQGKRWFPDWDLAIGKLLIESGREAEGRSHLERAAKSCHALFLPIAQTRAHAVLASVLEHAGDVAGACAEYDVVLARWGKEPRSVTAKRARERVAELKCRQAERDSGQ